jgi:hypothetical protein
MTKYHDKDLSRGTAISIRVGAPMVPGGADPAAQTAELKVALQGLLDEAIRSYPQHEDGAWWLPASYGGAAPTLAEAARLDADERVRRAERRATQGL